MADWNRILTGIGGAAAGFGGTGPQYLQMMQRQRENEEYNKRYEQQQQQQRQMQVLGARDERQQKVAQNIKAVESLLEGPTPRIDRAVSLLNDSLLGGGTAARDAAQLKEMILKGGEGGLPMVQQEVKALVNQYQNQGLLPMGEAPEIVNPNMFVQGSGGQGGLVTRGPQGGTQFQPVEGVDMAAMNAANPVPGTTDMRNYELGERLYKQGMESGDMGPYERWQQTSQAAALQQANPNFRSIVRGENVSDIIAEDDPAAAASANEAGRRTEATRRVEREQGWINEGITSAGSITPLKRAQELLSLVETGGVSNDVRMAAEELFGITSADQGELSYLLGINVIQQLKPVFGSAFSVEEFRALDSIEASMENNPAVNKRLLDNAMQIMKRGAERGLRAAIAAGDKSAEAEIRYLIDFNFGQDNQFQPTGASSPGQNTGGPVNRIRFDANGNQI